jgi:xanthine dehydrogenase YagS FAD-binding subunit
MASLAMGVQVQGTTIQDARVVFGGISGKPYREPAVEGFLRGKPFGPELAAQAQAVALTAAAPLKYNAEKIDMAKGLLASGLEKLSA